MSVQGEINRIKDAVSDSYSAVSDKGGEMPATQNVANLAQAVRSIPTGSNDVFIAEYGVTTYQEIDAAYNNGKTLLALDGERTYLFAGTSTINGVPYYNFYTFWSSSQVKNIRCYLESDYPNNWYTVYYVANEASSNKKITIDDTTKNSNTYYPTTKAVYDFVNGQKEVFIAEYGVTTYQEIKDARDAGKVIIAVSNGELYLFGSISSSLAAFFGLSALSEYIVTCSSQSQWTIGSWNLENAGNKTSTIDDNNKSSTSYYPTTKAVYDFAAPKIKVANVTLATGSWVASGNNYEQSVTITGTTANSKIDIQPDATAIAQLINDSVTAMYFQNDNGTVKAIAVGAKPTASMTVQVTITEVAT